MQRTIFGLCASFLLAGGLVVGQEESPSGPPAPSAQQSAGGADQSLTDPNDKTFTGCLIQGDGPNNYVLENAKPESGDASPTGRRFALAINAQPEQMKAVLNTHVRIIGTTTPDASAAGASEAKESLSAKPSTITVKRITRLAATCPATTPGPSASSANN